MTYKAWWVRAWCVAAAVGVGVAMLEWTPLVTAGVVLGLAVCVAIVLALLTAEGIVSTGATSARAFVATRSLAAGAGLVSLLALASASPTLALLAALLLLGSAPPLLDRITFGRARPPAFERQPRRLPDAPSPAPSATPGPTPPAHPALAQLDDHALCGLWRQTFWELREQQSVDEVLAMIALREACWDELERRNPAALHAWLESGARASGGPERFWLPGEDTGEADAG
jgi:hypothetical protein